MADDYELAESLTRAAGLLAAEMLLAGLTTMHKTSITDVVSAADHAAEALVVERLRAERPDEGLIGEEGTNVPATASDRSWHIDPVDGTYNFLSGLPVWCSAVGRTDAAGPELGSVYQPTTDELWLGGRDRPTSLNGTEVAPLVERPLRELSISTYLHPSAAPDSNLRGPLIRVIDGAATTRMLGSGSVELASVASGRLGAWVQANTKSWDWVPGAALVEAAGGRTAVLEAHGHRWHIAGNPLAVEEIVALIRRAD